MRTGVLVRNASDPFSISAKARGHRRELAEASAAREGYYKARRYP